MQTLGSPPPAGSDGFNVHSHNKLWIKNEHFENRRPKCCRVGVVQASLDRRTHSLITRSNGVDFLYVEREGS